jgi:hypothetical protein
MEIALIKDGKIENLAEFAAMPEKWEGFELVNITDIDPRPDIGWLHDAGVFSPPVVDALEVWLEKMAASDLILPRWAEDLFDLVTGEKQLADLPELAANVAGKKTLRSLKP